MSMTMTVPEALPRPETPLLTQLSRKSSTERLVTLCGCRWQGMGQLWTESDLVAWAEDDVLVLYTAETTPLPLPVWLARPHSFVEEHSVGQRLAASHPTDRQALIDLWWKVIRQPDEPFELEMVVQNDHGWARVRVRLLNLIDHPEVGGVLVAMKFLREVES